MKWVEAFFRWSLRLYPPSFRERFAEEMCDVFDQNLRQAREQDALAPFLLRELVHLPASLVDVYVWAATRQREGQMALSGAGGSLSAGAGGRSESWGAALLAGLPHLLAGLVAGGPTLLIGLFPIWGEAVNQGLEWLLILLLGLAVLTVLVYSLRRGWKGWSASWALYLVFLPAALLIAGLQSLPLMDDLPPWTQGVILTPLLLAMVAVLYKIACKNRVNALLAALPLALIFWNFFQEFVPNLLRGLAYLWAFGLAFAAAALILRARRYGAALALALSVVVLGGLPFVYLGVYHGGTLPYSEPGPSLGEIFRQFIPFLGLSSAALLGPQLAAQMRALGRESRLEGGTGAARLALSGLLVAIAGIVAVFGLSMDNRVGGWLANRNVLNWLLTGGGLLYLLGLGLLARALVRSGVVLSDPHGARDFALLAAVLPGIPLSATFLMGALRMGDFLAWGPLQAVLLAWILVSAWVAVRGE